MSSKFNQIYENSIKNPEKFWQEASKIMKYINQKNRAVEKHTLLFNHPEFLKA